MARALIVGCGCRGRELGGRLAETGWAVRGTSRSEEGLAAIAAAGIEAAPAEPSRPGTVLDLVGDVAVLIWLMGSAAGGEDEVGALHGDVFEHLLLRLVDTPVRGVVYEAAGGVEPALLARGEEVLGRAASTWRIRTATISAGPDDPAAWLADAAGAIGGILTAGR